MRIRIADDAFADLDDGYWFYELQDAGLGDYFASALRSDIEGLRISAGIHRRDYRDYHRVLSRVFPYAIYYTFAEDEVVVWAVIDCRRDPEWIRDRLDR
ncbi:MAG TPA: type II toxin-antitoxin system RelE/ParE family toxin [Bacteroidia bacterium]|nr:type II toxin-antitoxin system RelE/ParE family toxin [Bacteroidia bacterium]